MSRKRRGDLRTLRPWLARLAFALTAALVATAPTLALEVPFLSGRVVDLAGLIDAEGEARIGEKLEAFEGATGNQVAVLTIPSLEGEALEEFSLRVSETWGLGRKDVDDGVLLLVAQNDRKMRIEVGYGLEHQLTDAQSGRILNNVLRPRFRSGDFSGGIEHGVDVILGTLEGADVIPPEQRASSGGGNLGGRLVMGVVFFFTVGLFSLQVLFGKGLTSWILWLFLMPFWAVFPGVIIHPKAGMVCLALWIIFVPIIKFVLARTGFGKSWTASHPGMTNWTSGRGGGGWSSGGGGGFSGGGGSFGGGGASGGW